MEYENSDSSGTDDDVPPQSQMLRCRLPVTGRDMLPNAGSQDDMEPQIHNLEKDAYFFVLRAFNAQADSITWAKEGLITDLRKELRVSDEEHRELLARVNADGIIKQIREWRLMGVLQPLYIANNVCVAGHSPSVSESHKKQKIGHGHMHSSTPLSIPGEIMGHKSRKSKDHLHMSANQGGKSNRVQQELSAFGAKSLLGQSSAKGRSTMANMESLIGRKVLIRWPEDNDFYEAVIADFHHEAGEHMLVYGMNTPDETVEWVDMKAISPSDIKWDGPAPAIIDQIIGSNLKKTSSKAKGILRGNSFLGSVPPQNGKCRLEDIELRRTDNLIKEVEQIMRATCPDPADMEKAKKALKEHELSLLEALERLSEVSDGDSERNPPSSRTHSLNHEQVRKRHFSKSKCGLEEYNSEDDGRIGSAAGDDCMAADNMLDGYDVHQY